MESLKTLGAFPEPEICAILANPETATFWTRVYSAEEATKKVGSFSASNGQPVEGEDLAALVEALSDSETYHHLFATYHQPEPEFLVEISGPAGELIVLIDRPGGKLGFLHDGAESARDRVADSEGFGQICALIERYGSRLEGQQ